MKFNIIKRFASVALLTTLVIGCSEDDESTPNKIYIHYNLDNVESAQIYHHPINGSNTNLNLQFPIKSTKPTVEDMAINIAIDNNLIESYNIKNETTYQAAPNNSILIENSTLHIPAGGYISIDSVTVTIPDPSLLTEKNYLIPIKITNTNSSSSKASNNRSTLYIKLSTTKVYVDENATHVEDGVDINRDNWNFSITAHNTVVNGAALDANVILRDNVIEKMNSSYYISKGAFDITVNMGAKEKVKAIKLAPFLSGYSTRYYDQIAISEDGSNWEILLDKQTTMQSIVNKFQYIIFFTPIETQFIRVRLKSVNWSYSSCSEFHLVSLK